MNDIWAIVLAAGMSTRMGTQKLLLPFGGMTIIEKVVENILESGIENILVVLGSNRDEMEEVLEFWPVQTIWNENYRDGMHTSVIKGIKVLPENTRAVAFFLGDQPLISPESVREVVEAWQNSRKGIVLPVYEGKRGHPALYDLRLRNEILNLDPSVGLRSVAQRFPDEVEEVEVFCPEILKDIDTQEDYLNEFKTT